MYVIYLASFLGILIHSAMDISVSAKKHKKIFKLSTWFLNNIPSLIISFAVMTGFVLAYNDVMAFFGLSSKGVILYMILGATAQSVFRKIVSLFKKKIDNIKL